MTAIMGQHVRGVVDGKTFKFWKPKGRYGWRNARRGPTLCSITLLEHFNIPTKAKRLWATLHRRPGPDRLKVKVTPHQRPTLDVGRRSYAIFNDMGDLLREEHLLGQTFWVSFEYEC